MLQETQQLTSFVSAQIQSRLALNETSLHQWLCHPGEECSAEKCGLRPLADRLRVAREWSERDEQPKTVLGDKEESGDEPPPTMRSSEL